MERKGAFGVKFGTIPTAHRGGGSFPDLWPPWLATTERERAQSLLVCVCVLGNWFSVVCKIKKEKKYVNNHKEMNKKKGKG